MVSDETARPERGYPTLDLIHPVGQRGLGDDDEMWGGDVTVVLHVAKQGDRLQRLTQAHLIGKDTVNAVLVLQDKSRK